MKPLLATIVIPILLTIAIPFCANFLKKYSWILSIIPALLFVLFASLSRDVRTEGRILEEYSWYSSLGVNISLNLDAFSLIMCLLITGVGTCIFLYASGYLKDHEHINRFYILILLFMAAMLGIVLSDNLIMVFIFWELTTITSYLLVGFNHSLEGARKSAQQALLVTGIGGLILFAGILILGFSCGTFTISEMTSQVISRVSSSTLNTAAVLILIGCFTKSAQFPFHFWLPNAMAAPAPVSAYLHSATMVKAGVYLIYRMSSVFALSAVWSTTLMIVGGFTMIFAAVAGLFYKDLKKILAYSTVSVLGMLTLLAGIGTELSIITGIAVLVGHALYKAVLFMVAGSIDHETGTRDVLKLGGLRKLMPWTFCAALLAALSQAGVPPFLGFIGKEYFYKSGLYSESSLLIVTISVTASIILVVLAFTAGIHSFTGKFQKNNYSQKVHEAPLSMLAGPVTLGVLGLLIGCCPSWFYDLYFSQAASQLGFQYTKGLHLWEGLNTAFILSVITVITGTLIYFKRDIVWSRADRLIEKRRFRFDKVFAGCLTAFVKFSKWQTRIIQNGSLKSYMVLSISGFLLLISITFFSLEDIPYAIEFSDVTVAQFILVFVMGVSALLAAFSSSLIFSIVALGLIGFGMPLIYMMYGAPDLAITQILVETLTAVMFMAVIYKLPSFSMLTSKAKMTADFIFASFAGAIVTLLIFKAHALQLSSPVSERMAEISYTEAKGKNIVNVILVDFRALDTLGEISVLLIAVIGGAVLVTKTKGRKST
jgi:multicomponent Na+:H+ antiporter subunit A